MTINTTHAVTGPLYPNGVTTEFSFDFQAGSVGEVGVELDGVPLASSQFTVALNADGTGVVTITPAPASGGEMYVLSDPSFTQTTDWQRTTPVFPDRLVPPMDAAARRDIWLKAQIERSLRVPIGEVAPPFPSFIGAINQLLGTTSSGTLAWLDQSAFKGEEGDPAPPPQVAYFTLEPGQTRIPASGPLVDEDGEPFNDSFNFIALYLNGLMISNPDNEAFSHAGGSQPILLAEPIPGDDPIPAVVIGGARPQTSAGGGALLSTLLHVHRFEDDTHDMQAVWRAYRKGFRDIIAMPGLGLGVGADAGKYLAKGFPWEVPPSPDFDTAVDSRGNLSLPDDGLPGAGQPMHGLRLRGLGMTQTIWKQIDNYAFNFNSRTPDDSNNITGLVFEDFKAEGLGGEPTQVGHIFAIGGAFRPVFRRIKFSVPSADGIAFQSSPNPANETHTYFPLIEDCVFDGETHRGRNCVSIEGAEGGTIRNNEFRNWCVNSDIQSVAAIDIEPFTPLFLRFGGWRIEGNIFEDIDRGGIALYLNNPDNYDNPSTGYIIRNNIFRRTKRSLDFSGGFTSEIDGTATGHSIVVEGNIFEDTGDLRCQGMKNVLIRGNIFLVGETIKLGDQNLNKGNINVRVEDNLFSRFGAVTGITMLGDEDCYACTLKNNTFYECGDQSNTEAPGYIAILRYGSQGIDISDNKIYNFEGRIKAGFLLVTDGDQATYAPDSNKQRNIVYGEALTVPDTFSPPSPLTGLSTTYVIAGAVTVTSYSYFDVPILGATPDKFFYAKRDQFKPDDVVDQWFAACSWQNNVVRVGVQKFGAVNLSLDVGNTITVRELFA